MIGSCVSVRCAPPDGSARQRFPSHCGPSPLRISLPLLKRAVLSNVWSPGCPPALLTRRRAFARNGSDARARHWSAAGSCSSARTVSTGAWRGSGCCDGLARRRRSSSARSANRDSSRAMPGSSSEMSPSRPGPTSSSGSRLSAEIVENRPRLRGGGSLAGGKTIPADQRRSAAEVNRLVADADWLVGVR